jgi:hypothetical protein
VLTTAKGIDLSSGALAGAYTISGAALTTLRDALLLAGASPGAYVVSGASLTTLLGTVLSAGASPGVYTITGLPITELYNVIMVAAFGTYLSTGAAVDSASIALLIGDPGVYIIVGEQTYGALVQPLRASWVEWAETLGGGDLRVRIIR